MGIFAFVCFTALVFFGFHKVFHKPTEEPKDDDDLSAVAAHECLQEDEEKDCDSDMFSTSDVYDDENASFESDNLSDIIERESWLDEVDRSSADDPWDSDNEDDY